MDKCSELADLWRELKDLLVEKPRGFCDTVWVPSHAMEEFADVDLERKRREKLERARAQTNWQELWLTYNDHADSVAKRARERHPVPREVVARVRRVDSLAKRALLASVGAVSDACPASRR